MKAKTVAQPLSQTRGQAGADSGQKLNKNKRKAYYVKQS
jgi:hypothetical protein